MMKLYMYRDDDRQLIDTSDTDEKLHKLVNLVEKYAHKAALQPHLDVTYQGKEASVRFGSESEYFVFVKGEPVCM